MPRLALFLHSHAHPNPGSEGLGAAKTLTYALMHLAVAMGVAFALTRDWRAALAIGLVEPLVQTVAYTLHERAWTKAQRERLIAGPAFAAHQSAS